MSQSPSLLENPPLDEQGVLAYAGIFSQVPTRSLIANVETRLGTIRVEGGSLLPVSVNDGGERDNCYVCSPHAQYVQYAAYELSRLGRPWLEAPLQGLLASVGPAFRCADLDRVVIVNNWLLSTNLYPSGWRGEGLEELVAALIARYPDHAILFRSLNVRQNPALLAAFRAIGARLLASRVVWHYEGADPLFTQTADCRRDARLLENPAWEIVGPQGIGPGEMEAFARLYEQLYVEKYTALNPRYTPRYFALCHERGSLRFQGLRERATGRWLGTLGVFERDGVLTAPVVGYDTAQPQALGLYRALMALVMRETARRGVLLNLSAGAGSFKQLRGGVPCAEFTAVVDAHLPLTRRWPWSVLETLSNRVGLPMAWRKEVGP